MDDTMLKELGRLEKLVMKHDLQLKQLKEMLENIKSCGLHVEPAAEYPAKNAEA